MRHFFGNIMKTEQLYQLFLESTGISTDTRTLSKGQLFFALWGDNYNGNKFAEEALQKGASWAVIDDPAFETEKTVLVDDCLFELQALASYHRKELQAQVIAITGTNGKTTTKELIASILARKFKVHSTIGNLNNQIGVPLTLLSAPQGTQIMVVEMGASHIGEIRSLCIIARPDFGIITNIGNAHIEGFGSHEGVVKAKTELFEYLRKINGVAFYNEKDHLLAEKIFRMINRAVPFSDPTGIDLIVTQDPSDLYLKLSMNYLHKTYKITTKIFGSYNFENIRAAIAVGMFFEVDIDQIIDAVQNYTPGNNRSQVTVTRNNTIICDSYNANPTSMRMAIESFATTTGDKKMCILGDMLELGERSEEEHQKILLILKENNLNEALLLGNTFMRISKGTGLKAFPEISALKDYLARLQPKGYNILVKGSRGIALENVYSLL